MQRSVFLLLIGLAACGCAATSNPCLKQDIKKAYTAASQPSKESLLKDLVSGQINNSTNIDYIRSTYGDADDMLVTSCTIRLIYRLSQDKSITLWFEDGWNLSMWSK